ncbi:prepilin-type N-terminal cleavage/methylation domain-containing protein [Cognaticolwellia mytili]|uniref:prepilin-type N-terminal cleavage/methylation domain-containing protein n=1 Tax=Cognaticolwellia mytili TaxID=1888913 RepID=UPI000A1719B3|nr:prepilin-type N-terminal cleavage/methylation domain-containing protein [Cognaticolwellia mytili]
MKGKIQPRGFTLIELMIVMSIVALLMGMVGPLAINSLEKAQAKQEMLTVKNWLKKVSFRAFTTGKEHVVKFSGKNIILHLKGEALSPIENKTFESLFFQPQQLSYSAKGFVSPKLLSGTFRGKPMVINLSQWVNDETAITIDE